MHGPWTMEHARFPFPLSLLVTGPLVATSESPTLSFLQPPTTRVHSCTTHRRRPQFTRCVQWTRAVGISCHASSIQPIQSRACCTCFAPPLRPVPRPPGSEQGRFSKTDPCDRPTLEFRSHTPSSADSSGTRRNIRTKKKNLNDASAVMVGGQKRRTSRRKKAETSLRETARAILMNQIQQHHI